MNRDKVEKAVLVLIRQKLAAYTPAMTRIQRGYYVGRKTFRV